MPVVRFDPTRENFVVAGDSWFFLMSPRGRERYLVKGRCPHRGGPLHLGRLDAGAGVVHCPWHDTAISIRRLTEQAVPLVIRRGAGATAVLADSSGAPAVAEARLVLATCH